MQPARPTVLNVGASSTRIPMPERYAEYEQLYLDIDPQGQVDVIADVRDMPQVSSESFDAVYCSHLLEHFHPWEVPLALSEMRRVLKVGGILELYVPHVLAVVQALVDGHEIDETLYESDTGPITPQDVLFGLGREIRRGNPYMAHKVGITPTLLERRLREAGFHIELLCPTGGKRFELCAMARRVSSPEAARPEETLLV